MYSLLMNIFWIMLLANTFLFFVIIVFLVNSRINIKRQVVETNDFVRVLKATKMTSTSSEAAEMLDISLDKYISYCDSKGLETPESRKEKKEEQERKKKEQEDEILAKEAKWHAEQERKEEEETRQQEEQMRERKERLKKFGFKKR